MNKNKIMAEFIDHSEFDSKCRLSCECSWKGHSFECYSTLHAAFMDIHCPECSETVLIVDTLGTECGTYVPRPIPRSTFRRRHQDVERLILGVMVVFYLLT